MADKNSFEKNLLDALIVDPDNAFKTLEENGFDFEKLKELDMGRLLVKEKFKLSPTQVEAVEFVFWICYTVERDIREIIRDVERLKIGIENPVIDAMLDKLYFGDKISIIEKQYAETDKDKEYITMLRKINDLRNHVAHGRFDELKFGGYELHDSKGQLKLLLEIMNKSLGKNNQK